MPVLLPLLSHLISRDNGMVALNGNRERTAPLVFRNAIGCPTKTPYLCDPFRSETEKMTEPDKQTMKKGIHPDYREVVFHDLSSDYKFVTRSTVQTRDTIEYEGKTYPLVKIEVSSQSHPFYTGKNVLLDTAGRVDKFRKRYGTK